MSTLAYGSPRWASAICAEVMVGCHKCHACGDIHTHGVCSDSQHLIQGYMALAAFAKRRKSQFHSRQDAARRFRARLPFSAFDPMCFQHYVDHGLTKCPGVPSLPSPFPSAYLQNASLSLCNACTNINTCANAASDKALPQQL